MTLKRTDSKVDKIKGSKRSEAENREQVQLSQTHLWASEAYRALDRNGLDCLDYIEINTAIHILGIQISLVQVHEKLQEIDHLQTGRISLQGFLELIDSIEPPEPLPIQDVDRFIKTARKSPSERSSVDIQRMMIFLRNKFHLFKERRLNNLERLCRSICLKETPQHDWVVRQNDIGDKVYVIIKGACAIFQKRSMEDSGQGSRPEDKRANSSLDNFTRTKSRSSRRGSMVKSPTDFLRFQAIKQSQMSTSSSSPSSPSSQSGSPMMMGNSSSQPIEHSTFSKETSAAGLVADHKNRASHEEMSVLKHSNKILLKYDPIPKRIKDAAGDFLGTLSVGTSFGELSFQKENRKRTSSVINLCNTVLLEISQEQYKEYIGCEQQLQDDDLQYYTDILKKPSADRTAKELQDLSKLTSELGIFRNLKENLKLRLAKIMTFQTESSGHVIFKQGEEGDSMYIVLSGACTARLKRDGIQATTPDLPNENSTSSSINSTSTSTSTSTGTSNQEPREEPSSGSEETTDRSHSERFGPVVKIIQAGDCFGEVLFLHPNSQHSKVKRSATIIVLQSCALAKVTKADYFSAINTYQQEVIAKGVEFVNSLPVFQGSAEDDLSKVYGLLKRIILGKNETVCKQGIKMDGFFIVGKGEVELAMKIRPHRLYGLPLESKRSSDYNRLKVVFLGPGCVFGEDSLLEEQAHYTITTTKRSELFYISKKDFEKHVSKQLKYRVCNVVYSLQKWLENESKKHEDVRHSINELNSRGRYQKSNAFQKLQFKYRLAKYGPEWWNEFDRQISEKEHDEVNYTSSQWEKLGLVSLEPLLRDNGCIHQCKDRARDGTNNDQKHSATITAAKSSRGQDPRRNNTAAMEHSLSGDSYHRDEHHAHNHHHRHHKPNKKAIHDLFSNSNSNSNSNSSSGGSDIYNSRGRSKKGSNKKKRSSKQLSTKPRNDWDRLVRSSSSLSSSELSSMETTSSVLAPSEAEVDIAASALTSVSKLSWQTYNILPKSGWVSEPLKPFKPWNSAGLCNAKSQMRQVIRYRHNMTQPRKLAQHRRRRAAAFHTRPRSAPGQQQQPPGAYSENGTLESMAIGSAIFRETGTVSHV